MTHHHPDHVGCIKEVLSTFPSAALVAHIDEKPFLVEGVSSGRLPSKNKWFRALAKLGAFDNPKATWPVDRVSPHHTPNVIQYVLTDLDECRCLCSLKREPVQACFVHGDSGDIHNAICEGNMESARLPAKETITWTQAKGHAPGSLMLRVGNNIIAGDVLSQMRLPW